jgi:aspartate/methionine/tyrosine aminotransferase
MESRVTTAARVAEIAPFHVMEVQTAARALEAAGRTVVHMEIGEPDFPTPAPVIAAAQAAIAGGDLYYTSALGLPSLREAIARHYHDHYGVDVSPERIVVTAGSSAALLLVLALLVNRDDRILLGDPNYPCNRHFVRVLEGEPVGIPVGPQTSYQLTASLVAERWDAHTRGVLIASPSNPTGTCVPRDEMQRIAAAVAQRGGHLIVDEIYLGLTYGSRPRSVLEFAHDAFVISSFSK